MAGRFCWTAARPQQARRMSSTEGHVNRQVRCAHVTSIPKALASPARNLRHTGVADAYFRVGICLLPLLKGTAHRISVIAKCAKWHCP